MDIGDEAKVFPLGAPFLGFCICLLRPQKWHKWSRNGL